MGAAAAVLDSQEHVLLVQHTYGKLKRLHRLISACEYWSAADLPHPISNFTIRRIEDALRSTPQVLPVLLPPREWLD
jgi:hypothetical protein